MKKPPNIQSKFDQLYETLSGEEFLQMKSLNGEVPFHVTEYSMDQHLEYQAAIHSLIKRLQSGGINVLEVHLYDLLLEFLQSKNLLNRLITVEERMNQKQFLKALRSSANFGAQIKPWIHQRVKKYPQTQIYFLNGLAEIHPVYQITGILENLQSVFHQAPTVIFYPGTYEKTEFKLFDQISEPNYYRAYHLDKTLTS